MAGKIHRNSLKPGHKILWYEIKEVLGQGGFGITYLAYDPNLKKNVAIKEYLPIELAVRERDHSVHPVSEERGKQYKWGLDRFIKEAQTLAQFDHPNIVRVHSVTEENNTAYMVMAFEHGQTLQEKLKGKKTLEEAELLKILIPILGGLEQIHNAGFIHRDIKPDNIFIRADGSPVLLDFGSARQALCEQTKTLTSLITPGYAPFEQYFSKSDEQGEYTDIYGLGATLYRAISGVPPMDAADRSNAIIKSKDTLVSAVEIGTGKYSERFLKAIDHALEFKQEDRPQTIAEWKSEFELPEDPIKEAEVIEQKITQPGTKALESRQKKKAWSLGMVLLVGVILSVGISLYYRDEIKIFIEADDVTFTPVDYIPIFETPPINTVEDEPAAQRITEKLQQTSRYMDSEEEQQRMAQEMREKYARRGAEEYQIKSLIEENKFDEAEDLLARAVEIKPDSVEAELIRKQIDDAKEAEQIALVKKRKLEEEEKRLAELENKKQEAERIELEEKRRLEEEEQRLAELERQEQEERKRIEEETRAEEEKEAVRIAILEQERLENEKLDNKFCNEVLGAWSWKGWKVFSPLLREGGKVDLKLRNDEVFPPEIYTQPCSAGEKALTVLSWLVVPINFCSHGLDGLFELKWSCSDPKNWTVNLNFTSDKNGFLIEKDITATLSEDGQCLKVRSEPNGEEGCFRREDFKPTEFPKPTVTPIP